MHDTLEQIKNTSRDPVDAFAQLIEQLRSAVADPEASAMTLSALQRAVAQGLTLEEPADAVDLAANLGPQHYAKLRSNLVRLHCNSCHNGHEPCSSCDGIGLLEEGSVCRACAGFAKVRCDFCGGTGLSSYDVFPRGLCPEIARGRVALAVSRSMHIQSVAHVEDTTRRCTDSKWIQRVLNYNMLLGVLENARTEMTRLAERRGYRAVVLPVRAAAESGARQTFERLQKALAGLVVTLTAEATSSPNAIALQTRIAFYESLLQSRDFKGTPMEHPFLTDLLN